MENNYRTIENCRLCQSSKLELHFDFGSIPLGNNLKDTRSDALCADRYPLAVNRCVRCGHFQLNIAIAPEKLYATNYTYLSGVGKSFVNHFQDYAKWIKEKCNFTLNALVIDVGSNDGTCLKEFKKLGFRVCGVDPASIPAQLANDAGIDTFNLFFDEDTVDKILAENGKADFVTSHNVLAHIDDLRAILKNIYKVLKVGGYFCFEVGYFREVLKTSCFDTIYHEHLDYHHAKPLSHFLSEIGFDLIDLSVNQIQGGSLRLFLQKTGEGIVSPQAKRFLDEETRSILYHTDIISSWQTTVKKNIMQFGDRVRMYVASGKTVVGYGAPTKATLLMEMSELEFSDISFIVEDNLLKVDKFMPFTGVPILEVGELYRKKPDIIIIFAWNFYEDIIAKLKLQVDWPVTFLVPLPNFIEESL
jgi:SAM-dependent methyltransferase